MRQDNASMENFHTCFLPPFLFLFKFLIRMWMRIGFHKQDGVGMMTIHSESTPLPSRIRRFEGNTKKFVFLHSFLQIKGCSFIKIIRMTMRLVWDGTLLSHSHPDYTVISYPCLKPMLRQLDLSIMLMKRLITSSLSWILILSNLAKQDQSKP